MIFLFYMIFIDAKVSHAHNCNLCRRCQNIFSINKFMHSSCKQRAWNIHVVVLLWFCTFGMKLTYISDEHSYYNFFLNLRLLKIFLSLPHSLSPTHLSYCWSHFKISLTYEYVIWCFITINIAILIFLFWNTCVL